MKDCQDYFALSFHPILSNITFSNLNGMLRTRNYNLFWNQHLTRRNTHSLTHCWGRAVSCLKPLTSRNRGVHLSPLIHAFVFTFSTGRPSLGTLSPASTGGDRQVGGQSPAAGRGDTAAPPVWGPVGFHLFEGWGGQAKWVSWQALLQSCHPAALSSNVGPGTKSPPCSKTDQAKIFVLLQGLFDYWSQSCNAETALLHSTCTRLRGPCNSTYTPSCKPCTLLLS